ncbi:conserved hypothetical protein [Hyella patelloides LEGE 07179]|uniref:T6SS Phospholipase effector Tle1-like catalytic domain-containing protein n=1 Tax=Hyella patelloides LEGE 07179 TaxID=945734 RepID=A0A563W4M4_9CYAN|nr:DUF2235 domain-containing protein [Hyella patelloides]VEP18597.1 conserved hypothetical protein [Hyella patelloides LEGE 07179]
MKRLIVCCDGTWQKLSSDYPTNVVKITQAIKLLAEDKTQQIVFYDEGIGTRDRDKVDKIFGGVTGWGIDQNIQDAYRFLCLNYNEGDEIYLYGFSRGAYTVRSLAGLIYCSGLLHRHKIRLAPKAYQLYRKQTKPEDISIPNTEEAINFRRENSVHAPITFLGCWDTVGALGIPDQISWLSVDKQFNQKYQFHDTSLSPIIQHARHAVAIDEIRKVFDFTPMTKSSKNDDQNLLQMWFPGEHGCVGGGTNEQSGLSDSALQWMIDESKALGLEFDESKVIDGINPDPTISFKNTPKLIFALAKHNFRKVDVANLHPSVIERWSKVDDYRPANLAMYKAQLDMQREIYLAQHRGENFASAA